MVAKGMLMGAKATREQIISAADQLFYRQGFDHTSFADIAAVVKISRGNFYYHFRSKDEILSAVIDRRISNAKVLLGEWQQGEKNPVKRIGKHIDILLDNKGDIKLYGCPDGTLANELAKLKHSLANEANRIFTLYIDWLAVQFILLGHEKQAEQMARHLLARIQGVAIIAMVTRDDDFVRRETKQMRNGVKTLSEVKNYRLKTKYTSGGKRLHKFPTKFS